MTTPSMRVIALLREWKDHPEFEAIDRAIEEAFTLGHEFGLVRAADVVDQCNRDGHPAIMACRFIRQLKVERVQHVATHSEDFL